MARGEVLLVLKRFYQAAAILILTLSLLIAGLQSGFVYAAGETAVYTAPDGFKVVSYSWAWSDQRKLKSVYEELLKNTHGEEFKLLNKIILRPGRDSDDLTAAGRWYGVWKTEKGQPRLVGNRYIEIFNTDKLTNVESIARTLAHEYGHHFTYYYYFKKEKKLWEHWRATFLAEARGLKTNPRVGALGVDHKWLIQEIAAEDYVQLFGSPTLRTSIKFADIAERLNQNVNDVTFSSDVFNYHPQENYEIPLAANIKALKDYWLKAAGLTDKTAVPPPLQISLRLTEVNKLHGIDTPQYIFTWDKSSADRGDMEYTLVCFNRDIDRQKFYPIKTAKDGEPLKAVIGAATGPEMYLTEEVPTGVAYYMVYIKNGDGVVTSSQVLAVDFTVPLEPQTVLVDDAVLVKGGWFPPRLKINGKQVNFAVKPEFRGNYLLVPLRTTCQELGATVEWDELSQAVVVKRRENTFSLSVGSPSAVVNGSRLNLSVTPMTKNGQTIVPLGFICQALDVEVEWNQLIQLAIITTQINSD